LTEAGHGGPPGPATPAGGAASPPERAGHPVPERIAKGVLAAAGIVALVFVASAVLGLMSPSCACTTRPAPTASAAIPASPIDGVVVKIDSTGIGNVRGFTMRLVGGATLDMTLGTLENAAQFAPGHLAEHQATASPVRAYFVLSGGVPVVYRLEDAPLGPSSSP
jgi:hypothetical protein